MAKRLITSNPPPLPDESEGMQDAANKLLDAKLIGMPSVVGIHSGYDEEPRSGVVTLAEFAAERVAAAARRLDNDDFIGGEGEDHADEYALTPPILAELHAERVSGGEADFGDLDDEDDGTAEVDDAVLEYDENGNPLKIKGYIPGLTPHPGDVEGVVRTIGSVVSTAINPALRRDQEEAADHYGRTRLLAEIYRLNPSGRISSVNEDSSAAGLNQRMYQAAEFLIRSISNVKLDENEAFNLVAQALINVWRSRWDQHLDDDIVQDVTNQLLNEDITAEELMVAMEAIDLSKDFATYKILMKVADFADDFGDQVRNKGKESALNAHKYLDGARLWKEDHNLSQTDFDTYLVAMDMAESWPEAFLLAKILQLDAGERVDFYNVITVAKRKKINRNKALLLAKINMLRELMTVGDEFTPAQDNDQYLQSLMQLSKCGDLAKAHSKMNKVLKPNL